jgi:hypothetical protein
MKNILSEIFWGRNNKFNGLVALLVVGSIVLGCTCGKDFKLGKDNNTYSNSSTDNSSNSPFGKDPFSRNSNTNSSTNTTTEPKDTNYTKADASKKEVPSDAEMQEIVKTTLLDFNEALQQKDFTDFHGKISRVWAKQTNPDKLKQGFQTFIDGRTDISSISSMNATFTSEPSIIKNLGYNMLSVKGEYSTSPIKTTFELQYVPEGKDWKLALIRVVAPIKK